MKEDYLNYIKQEKLINVLDDLNFISFSKKLEILKNLKKDFSSDVINNSLRDFFNFYIVYDRDQAYNIEKVLKGLCKKYLIEREKQ